MKAIVITVPDGFKTAVVTVTYEGAEGKNNLETKSTRGQDTNWILDFSETDKTEKSNKVTFEDYFRTVFPEYDERKGAVSEYCVADFLISPARQLPVKTVGKEHTRKTASVKTACGNRSQNAMTVPSIPIASMI